MCPTVISPPKSDTPSTLAVAAASARSFAAAVAVVVSAPLVTAPSGDDHPAAEADASGGAAIPAAMPPVPPGTMTWIPYAAAFASPGPSPERAEPTAATVASAPRSTMAAISLRAGINPGE
jgi:hypothetical protein